MLDTPSAPEPTPCPSPDTRCSTEAMEARHSGVLQELAEIGMEHARIGLGHALNETMGRPVPRPAADPQLGYARVARSVRQTLALEAKFREGSTARAEKAETERVAERQARGEACKSDVREAVEQLIETEAGESREGLERAERLLDDLYERLDDAPDEDFADVSVRQAIETICRDLGLTPDWRLWADEAWARREAREGAPGSPYAPPALVIEDDDPP